MGDNKPVPLLMQMIFEEAAEIAVTRASDRLRRWSEGFERWLEAYIEEAIEEALKQVTEEFKLRIE
jgi:hypothetical protein